jgi:hypothetical protein
MANKFDISCDQPGGPFTLEIEKALASLDQNFANSVNANTQIPYTPDVEHGLNLPGRMWFDRTDAKAILKIYTGSSWVKIAERKTTASEGTEMVVSRADKADALRTSRTVNIVTVPNETTYASGSFTYDGTANSSLALKVEKSVALKTARTFSISGGVTTATTDEVSFDGTSNVDIAVTVDNLGGNGRGNRHVVTAIPTTANWATGTDSNFDIYYVY